MNWNLLDPRLIALAAVIVVLALVAWLYVHKRRSTNAGMLTRFGPEYVRVVLTHGSE